MPKTAAIIRNLQTIDAAANYLNVSQRTIRRYIADGKLPAYRIGDTLIRVEQADLDALVSRVPAIGA